MSNLKTSISILAIVAGLSIGFASQPCFAQAAGAATVGQAIEDNIDHRDDQLSKLDEQERQRRANIEKQKAKPETTTGIDTGGKSGFATPSAEVKPEEPGLVEQCISGVCTIIKWAVAPGWMIFSDSKDEAKPDPDKKVEPPKTAEPQKSVVQKAAAPTSTELKTLERKTVETRTVAPEMRKSATSHVPTEAPKSRTETLPRTPVTTVSHMELSRPTVNVAHPTINVAHPTINVPHPTINIPQPTIHLPTIVAHR